MLNAQQQAAVNHFDGPLLILAGAGSGKTTVLIERIRYLIQQNIAPAHILAVTFTHKASEEMNERLQKKVGSLADDVTMMTFHALCLKILQQQVAHLDHLRADFTVLEPAEVLSTLYGIIAHDMKADPKKIRPNDMSYYISLLKNECIDPELLLATEPTPTCLDWTKTKTFLQQKIPSEQKKIIAEVYQRYQAKCQAENMVDFDDLLCQTIRLFQQNPLILAMYQQQYQYIMVDEYQDTNYAQYQFMRLLSSVHRNIVVVGDDFQSIYAFRGSDIRNILQFDVDFPDAKVIKLEENYRCGPYVLAAANEIIAKNKHQKQKHLFTSKKQGEKIGYYCARNERDEVRYVINEIQQLVRRGVPYRDIAILFRTNAMAKTFEDMFMRVSIPFQFVTQSPFLERPEIKALLSYCAFATNRASVFDFKRVINTPKRQIDRSAIALLAQKAKNDSLEEAFYAHQALFSFTTSNRLTQFFSSMRSLQTYAVQHVLHETVTTILMETGYLSYLHALQDEDKLAGVSEFISLAMKMEQRQPNATLVDFLDQLHDYALFEHQAAKKAVRFMTLHAAKGLEFPYVFLVGMEEGVFPHIKSMEGMDLEEERRLCYVGMTRAIRKLYFTHAKARTFWGKEDALAPSRFLYEFQEQWLDGTFPLYKPT